MEDDGDRCAAPARFPVSRARAKTFRHVGDPSTRLGVYGHVQRVSRRFAHLRTFTLQPLVFPGGSIGSLAVFGTANDLAMCGARPMYLTIGFILEEGLPIPELWDQVLAIERCCKEVSVDVVAGDTKVVERGSGDGMFSACEISGEQLPRIC